MERGNRGGSSWCYAIIIHHQRDIPIILMPLNPFSRPRHPSGQPKRTQWKRLILLLLSAIRHHLDHDLVHKVVSTNSAITKYYLIFMCPTILFV